VFGTFNLETKIDISGAHHRKQRDASDISLRVCRQSEGVMVYDPNLSFLDSTDEYFVKRFGESESQTVESAYNV
jgi:hypothetical protein